METDEALFARVRRGEMHAFDALYERYASRLYGFLSAMLRSRPDAEDVFHEAFLAALEAREVDLRAGGFRAWLYRIARNRALNVIRSKQRGDRAASSLEPQHAPPPVDERIAEREIGAALDGAVGRLPPSLSEVFHLRVSGLSYEEMAQVLEIPLGTIKSRMSQMVAVLREEMKPWTAG